METTKAVFSQAHVPVNGGQLLQRGVALSVPLHILDSNGFQRGISDGITGFIDHVSPAVLTDLD